MTRTHQPAQQSPAAGPADAGSVELSDQVISPELRAWIVTQLADGHSLQALHQSMREAGWDDAVTHAALRHIDTDAPAVALDVALSAAPTDAATPRAALQVTPPHVASRPMPGPLLDGAPLSIDAGDRRVRVLQTLQSPRLVVFGDLLSSEECDTLIADARRRLERSLTVETRTGGEALNVDRTSDGMFFERGETEVVRRIEARIARLLNWPLENGEGLQVLRYAPGAQYKPHFDYFDPDEPGTVNILQRGGQRVATLVIYIGEPAQGGGTTFPDVGLEVVPQRGNAVFFSYDEPCPSTRTLHGGAPVLAGEKWVATKWLREREFN